MVLGVPKIGVVCPEREVSGEVWQCFISSTAGTDVKEQTYQGTLPKPVH